MGSFAQNTLAFAEPLTDLPNLSYFSYNMSIPQWIIWPSFLGRGTLAIYRYEICSREWQVQNPSVIKQH